MLLSIITINYNNEAGLAKTIESVAKQSQRDFEYIVIDGASADGSVSIIEKYPCVSYWSSEKDNGVYNAMNKGIKQATGEYLLFLNSGDSLYSSTTISEIISSLHTYDIIYGGIQLSDGVKQVIHHYPDELSFNLFVNGSLPHPSSFIRRELFAKYGMYDESLKICSDWKFFVDAICKHKCTYKRIMQVVANFEMDGISSKSENAEMIRNERRQVLFNEYRFLFDDYNLILKDHIAVSKLTGSRAFRLLKKLGLFKYVDVHS